MHLAGNLTVPAVVKFVPGADDKMKNERANELNSGHRSLRRGFTLIELLVVVLILAILMAIAVVATVSGGASGGGPNGGGGHRAWLSEAGSRLA